MILISHRGNINGPIPELENSPEYIDRTLSKKFDVEIDLWVNNGKPYLGHDEPQYPVTLDYLIERENNLWVHCKNEEALGFALDNVFNCFYHDTDAYTLTSYGFIWAYPGSPVTCKRMFVSVLPERVNQKIDTDIYAVCTDYVKDYIDV